MPTTLVDLEHELELQFAHVLPATLVQSTVRAAWTGRGADPQETVRTARADVSALAQAALRAPVQRSA